jgi:O-antigen biosynthesis protein
MSENKTINKDLSVSVVIPNYNGYELLKNNLPSVIVAKENKNNKIGEIVVVDDGSTDKSCELIKKEFPSVRLIKHIKNRGFASAVNTGLRSSFGSLVVLLNTDVIPSSDFLENVIPYFEKSDVFAVSFHEKGYGYAKGLFKSGFILHEPGKEDENKHLTFWVSGGSGIFRRSMWFELGGLDEKLFNPYYWEDVDLGYRALKKGYKLYWEPNSNVIHNHETTIGRFPKRKRNLIQERNQLLFIWKNISSPRMIRPHFIGLATKIIKHPGYIKVLFAALFKLPYTIRTRRKVLKMQKLSDEAVFDLFK